MNICIFEIDAINIKRYFYDVIKFKLDDRIFVAIDSPDEFNAFQKNFKDLKAEQATCFAWYSIAQIENWLKINQIDRVIIDAHRIPDLRLILAAKKMGVKVVYIQHGLYIPFMKRSVQFYFRSITKTLRYLYYALNLQNVLGSYFAFKLFKVHVMGQSRSTLSDWQLIFPDQAFYFSEYWRVWHCKNYAFPMTVAYEIMGTPDFDKHKTVNYESTNFICYCYQTLVEDGRLSEHDMISTIKTIENKIRNFGGVMIIKGHPRMSDKIKVKFQNLGIKIFEDIVPITGLVVGHYSSLLPLWAVKGSRVICVEIPGHEVPDSFLGWAAVVEGVGKLEFNSMNLPTQKVENFYSIFIGGGVLRESI